MTEITATELELQDIPDYTADDYLNGVAPFEFLYTYIENRFLLGQMRENMKRQAASVGVRGFIGLWNDFKGMKEAKKGIRYDNVTAFDGQEMELYCSKYNCDDYGVTFVDRFGYEQVVCMHPIMPVRRLVNIDDGDERLEIAYRKGNIWRKTIVEKSVLASASSILELSKKGVVVNSENAKLLSTYLLEIEQDNYNDIPEQRSVGRLGWVGEDGFSPYVEGLSFDGESTFKHIFNAVRTQGSFDCWLEMMKKVRAEKSPGRLFLAASFASVLLEPCGLLPFFLHAWGGTEVGKTVGLMIAASVWGCPKPGEFTTTFNATSVGQEMTAAFLNSLPMCIDELQIQSSAGVKEFDKMIYQLTEGVGKVRGAKSGGLQRTASWRCCFITNGEQPISNEQSGGGAVNRIIEFECAEKVYSDLVGLCSIINENYGFAGKMFIELFKADPEGVTNFAVDLQKSYYEELLKYDSTEKQAASASVLLAADAIATELIFKDGNALTSADMAAIMTKRDDVNVNRRAYDFVIELCAANPNKFKANEFGLYQGEAWGKYEDDCIYIIKSVFNREMSAAGFNAASFLAWAKRMGLAVCDHGKRTKKARIGGVPVNCVCLVKKDEEMPFVEFDEKVFEEL